MRYIVLLGSLVLFSLLQIGNCFAFERGDMAATCHKKTWFNAPTQYFACVGKVLGQDGSGNYILQHMYGGRPNSITNLFSSNKVEICPSRGRTRSVSERQLFPLSAVNGAYCDQSYLE